MDKFELLLALSRGQKITHDVRDGLYYLCQVVEIDTPEGWVTGMSYRDTSTATTYIRPLDGFKNFSVVANAGLKF